MLKLGPKYTQRSRVGTWTLNQITVRVFKGRVGVDSAVGEAKGIMDDVSLQGFLEARSPGP